MTRPLVPVPRARAFFFKPQPEHQVTIQTIKEAQAIENRLSIRLDALEDQIEKATREASADVQALAQGRPVDTTQITALQAERMVLRDALARAQEGVATATRLAGVRANLQRQDRVKALMRERDQVGRLTSQLLDQVAENLTKVMTVGHELAACLGGGRDRLSESGYISQDPSELSQPSVLAHLVQIHLSRMVPGWLYANMPPFGGQTFESAVTAHTDSMLNELEVLGGFDMDLDDVLRVRAEMNDDPDTPAAAQSASTAEQEARELEREIAAGAADLIDAGA